MLGARQRRTPASIWALWSASDRGAADVADVVGYEVEASAALSGDARNVLIPLPDALSVSGEAHSWCLPPPSTSSATTWRIRCRRQRFSSELRGEN